MGTLAVLPHDTGARITQSGVQWSAEQCAGLGSREGGNLRPVVIRGPLHPLTCRGRVGTANMQILGPPCGLLEPESGEASRVILMLTNALNPHLRVWTEAEPGESARPEDAETGRVGRLRRAVEAWKWAREDQGPIYSSPKTASGPDPGIPATCASLGLWVNSASPNTLAREHLRARVKVLALDLGGPRRPATPLPGWMTLSSRCSSSA